MQSIIVSWQTSKAAGQVTLHRASIADAHSNHTFWASADIASVGVHTCSEAHGLIAPASLTVSCTVVLLDVASKAHLQMQSGM